MSSKSTSELCKYYNKPDNKSSYGLGTCVRDQEKELTCWFVNACCPIDSPEKKKCKKCELLMELFESAEQTNRNYWIMTELFVMLHGSDDCKMPKLTEEKK